MASKTEEQILRSRLVVEDRALKRCLRQLSTMCSRYTHLSPEETQRACRQVLQEARWFRHTVQVAVQVQRRCLREEQLYAEQQASLEEQVSATRSKIEQLSDSLEDSRNHKRHRIAYDEIATEANKRPTRQRLTAEIDEINGEIEQLLQEEASHEAVVCSLQAQYSVAVDELKKLADMSKRALNMQDLDIDLGDGEPTADKPGSESNHHGLAGISPATPQQLGDPRDGFDTPTDGAILEDSGMAGHLSSDSEEGEESEESEESEEGEEGEESEEGEEDELDASMDAGAERSNIDLGDGSEDEEGELLG